MENLPDAARALRPIKVVYENPENKVHLFLFGVREKKERRPQSLRLSTLRPRSALCAPSFFSPPRLAWLPVRPHRMWCSSSVSPFLFLHILQEEGTRLKEEDDLKMHGNASSERNPTAKSVQSTWLLIAVRRRGWEAHSDVTQCSVQCFWLNSERTP